MSEPHSITPDLATLATLFYSSPDELGQFDEVSSEEIPEPYRKLLAHENHMTVTVERFHDSKVDVQVLAKKVIESAYARKILLTKQSDGRVVQFGVMRVQMDQLGEEVAQDIRSEQIPLGRILISHGLLREVELVSLYKVTPGEDLGAILQMRPGEATYGRTALIHVDGEPVIQLIEIVAPC